MYKSSQAAVRIHSQSTDTSLQEHTWPRHGSPYPWHVCENSHVMLQPPHDPWEASWWHKRPTITWLVTCEEVWQCGPRLSRLIVEGYHIGIALYPRS